jgi:hypothetical protein
VYVADLDGSSLEAIDKGAKRYGEGHPVYVRFGEFTAKWDGADRTARDVYMKAISEGGRFKLHPLSGETLAIVGGTATSQGMMRIVVALLL